MPFAREPHIQFSRFLILLIINYACWANFCNFTSCMRRMTCYPLPFSITESFEKTFPHTFVVAHAVTFVIFKLRALLT